MEYKQIKEIQKELKNKGIDTNIIKSIGLFGLWEYSLFDNKTNLKLNIEVI